MARFGSGKFARFYQNPVLRDEEWNRAKQPSGPLMVAAVAIVAAGFIVGTYAGPPWSTVGWAVGVVTIAIYLVLGRVRRLWARRHLRRVHETATP